MSSASNVRAEEVWPQTGALVRAAQAGDRDAFGRLYAKYTGLVHAIALGCLPASDADDLVQEVFLRAFRRLNTLRDINAFGAWLATIARNAAHDIRQRLHEPMAAEQEPAAEGSQHQAMEAAAALDAIRSLPPAYRDTLLMRLVNGMSGPEIAVRTGLAPASVRVNLHRGMKLLRQRLAGGAERRRS